METLFAGFRVGNHIKVVSLPMRDGNLQEAAFMKATLVVSLPMRDGNFNDRELH